MILKRANIYKNGGRVDMGIDAVEWAMKADKLGAGEILLISQFTLYADCSHGNRPGFTGAGNPELANHLYEHALARCAGQVRKVEHGIFGADMKVELLNDGPFTILLDSDQLA